MITDNLRLQEDYILGYFDVQHVEDCSLLNSLCLEDGNMLERLEAYARPGIANW